MRESTRRWPTSSPTVGWRIRRDTTNARRPRRHSSSNRPSSPRFGTAGCRSTAATSRDRVCRVVNVGSHRNRTSLLRGRHGAHRRTSPLARVHPRIRDGFAVRSAAGTGFDVLQGPRIQRARTDPPAPRTAPRTRVRVVPTCSRSTGFPTCTASPRWSGTSGGAWSGSGRREHHRSPSTACLSAATRRRSWPASTPTSTASSPAYRRRRFTGR